MSHDHTWFVAFSYAVAVVSVVATVAAIMLDHRRLRRSLERLGAPVDEREDR